MHPIDAPSYILDSARNDNVSTLFPKPDNSVYWKDAFLQLILNPVDYKN